ALEAGAGAVNLGESQFGITSTAFRWGLSGAYQQSIPSYFSMGEDGVRHNFLEDYYRSLPELASSIFLKGYQWPFNAHRVENLGSSLIDIAVSEEIRAGRHVLIDFASNPYYGDEAFDIQSLPSEARNFLNKSGVRQRTPFERLEFMNPESIEVYSKQGIDLHEPVEVAVSFQHNNGGLAVNSHYETDVKGLFAVGEIAGTHGVSCPGGASLNAGQVGGIRAAEYISHHRRTGADGLSLSELGRAGRTVLLENRRMLESSGALHSVVRALIQGMMTRSAGFLRDIEPLKMACADAAALWRNCEVIAPKAADHRDIPRAWETRHLLLTAGAFMLSIYMYAGTSGGSRGSYLILQGDGPISGGGLAQVVTKHGPLFGYYIEDLQDRRHRLKVSGPELEISWEMVKPVPEDKGWFDSTWADWRDGTVFDQ
ncbi:MAG TPA: FAD-binding protein, partial [Chloroflexota bacterium]|nr:FAD-binding protein [Chloroflexota bacterium]